ncbi:MAG: Zn-ribbon domain-containing OB-fold protein [Mycobacteriales bacterium]
MPDQPVRVLPRLDDENRFFWTAGGRGALEFLRCQACGFWLHPPSPRCPMCLSRELRPERVSGRGSVASLTVNEQRWNPTMPSPYLIALVEIEEQPAIRLMTNLVQCRPEDARIGMRVRVVFEQHGEVYLPLFEPEQPAAGEPTG